MVPWDSGGDGRGRDAGGRGDRLRRREGGAVRWDRAVLRESVTRCRIRLALQRAYLRATALSTLTDPHSPYTIAPPHWAALHDGRPHRSPNTHGWASCS